MVTGIVFVNTNKLTSIPNDKLTSRTIPRFQKTKFVISPQIEFENPDLEGPY